MLKAIRNIALFLTAFQAVASWNEAAAFGTSAIGHCSMAPTKCATGTPETNEGSGGRLEVVRSELQHVKYAFFGTNRKIIEIDKGKTSLYKISEMFSDEASSGISVGYIEQFVNNKSGKILLGTASIEFLNDHDEINTILNDIGLEKSNKFVYVHGVNNSFGSAIKDSSILSGVSSNDFVPFCFSWPSRSWSAVGTISGSGYNHDRQINEESIPHFWTFFNKLAISGIAPLDIFAHSRGSYLVARFAERQILRGGNYYIKSIVLAAPDISKNVFYDFIQQIEDEEDLRITLYLSENDKALSLSELRNYTENLHKLAAEKYYKNVEFIDVDSIGSLLDHDFHRNNKNLAIDFQELIASGLPAKARRRVVLVSDAENRYRLEKP